MGSLDREEDTIQDEERHMAYQEIQVQVETLAGQTADWVAEGSNTGMAAVVGT